MTVTFSDCSDWFTLSTWFRIGFQADIAHKNWKSVWRRRGCAVKINFWVCRHIFHSTVFCPWEPACVSAHGRECGEYQLGGFPVSHPVFEESSLTTSSSSQTRCRHYPRVGHGWVGWAHVVQYSDRSRALVNTVMNRLAQKKKKRREISWPTHRLINSQMDSVLDLVWKYKMKYNIKFRLFLWLQLLSMDVFPLQASNTVLCLVLQLTGDTTCTDKWHIRASRALSCTESPC
jgi:hypothetical protein